MVTTTSRPRSRFLLDRHGGVVDRAVGLGDAELPGRSERGGSAQAGKDVGGAQAGKVGTAEREVHLLGRHVDSDLDAERAVLLHADRA